MRVADELLAWGQPLTICTFTSSTSGIAAEVEREKQQLTPYSFRHRYSAEGHRKGLQPKQLADEMGHSLEVHMGSYARFMTRNLADAFDAVNSNILPATILVANMS